MGGRSRKAAREDARRTSHIEVPLEDVAKDGYRSSSEDDLSLGEADPLNKARSSDKTFRGRQRGTGANYRDDPNAHPDSNTTGPSLIRSRQRFGRWGRCLLISLIIFSATIAIAVTGGVWVYRSAPKDGQSPPWYPTPSGGSLSSWEESYQKAGKMVSRMSLLEKVNITTGLGWSMGMCVGNTGPATQVGFPSLCLQDGPLGLRFADRISAFPAGLTVGATWNRELMYKRGRALGVEARLKGVNVLLGPAMGPLGRMPAGGRNWEGFGPDPVLQGVAAASTIEGIQDEGVIATAKHYILNEQEHFRQSFEWGLPNAMSSNIDDRTLHELYLWPFASSVRAGVGSVMCSYQMVNNSYACANSKLMNGILKDELGFQGFVQSDWLAQRSGVASALAGLDMTMPGDGLRWQNGESLWGSRLTEAALNESIPMSRLNDMAMRIVAAWYQLSQDEWPAPPPDGDGGPNFSSWTDKEVDLLHPGSDDTTKGVVNKFVDAQGTGNGSHGILIRKIAAEGTVLVKNEGQILPLYRSGWPANSTDHARSRLRVGLFGEDAGEGRGRNACADRGCNQGTLASGWGSGAVDYPYLVTPLEALKKAFDPEKVYLSSHPTNKPPFKATPSILTEQDICMVFINSDGGEGFIASDGIRGDRNDLYSQKGGDKLIQSVAEGCGNGQGSTIVVVHAIGPVILERWVDLKGVKAVILANLPGQESGNALADVLFGDVNPSGKLPYTVGRDLEDYGKGGQVMYYPNEVVPQQDFREGLYIDYRHFDKLNIEPRYEFGFGLSYTTFEFTNISLTTTKPKTPYPSPRPATRNPPTLPETLPPLSETIFPAGFRRLKEYIYPYLDKSTVIKKGRYPYPAGYEDVQPPSAAGGGEGGNPSLWDVHGIINVTVKNTGSRGGQEVVQLYVAFPENVPSEEDQSSAAASKVVDFPTKVLRGFDKIELAPGEVRTISLNLTRKDLSYWSIKQGNWVMPTVGTFKVLVGSSSRRLPLTVEL